MLGTSAKERMRIGFDVASRQCGWMCRQPLCAEVSEPHRLAPGIFVLPLQSGAQLLSAKCHTTGLLVQAHVEMVLELFVPVVR
jgi:hypothetical protein